MKQIWYRERDGRSIGPIDQASFEDLVRRSIIDVSTEIRHGAEEDWVPAGSSPQLFDSVLPQNADSSRHSEDASNPEITSVATTPTGQSINPYQAPAATELPHPSAVTPGIEIDARLLKSTKSGLQFVYCGICAALIGFVSFVGCAAIAAATENGAMIVLGLILGGIGCLTGIVLALIGQILCLTIPEQTGARRSIQVSILCLPLIIVVNLGGMLLNLLLFQLGSGSLNVITSPFPRLLSVILAFVSAMAFLRFLRHLATFLGRQKFASSASSIMGMAVATLCMYLFSSIVSLILAIAFPMMTVVMFAIGAIFLLGLLLTLITFVRTANLVRYVAQAIPKN